MRGRGLLTLSLLPLLALAACGERGQQQADTAGEEGAMAEAADTAPAEQEGTRVTLTAKNESGVTGSATLTGAADSLTVTLQLEGLTEGTRYPAHVHRGTCQAGGPVAAALNAVTGGAGGTGSSTSKVARAELSADQSYFLQAHLADGTPAACGNVPSLPAEGEDGGSGDGGMGGSASSGSTGGAGG